jgi:hypothetical protein
VKTSIAYAVIAVGIPVWAGHTLGPILSIPISLLVGLSRRSTKTPTEVAEISARDTQAWLVGSISNMAPGDILAHASLDILSGLTALFVTAVVFYLFDVHLGVVALGILIAWEIVLTVGKQSPRTLVCAVGGVVAGWFLARWLFSF